MSGKQIGRGLFNERPPLADRIDHEPTERQVRWLMMLNLHGCLSSTYLFAFEGEKTESQRRSAQFQLKRLWLSGHVYRPVQQRATDNANYHDFVYDLTDKGREYLKSKGLWVDALRPSGNWVHQLMISCITASLHILAEREGYRFIPAHEYLAGKELGTKVTFLWGDERHTKPLVPDTLCAIDYGNKSFIAYCIEADRDTETRITDNVNKKSITRTVKLYEEFIGKKRYKDVYKRNSTMMLLHVTASQANADTYLRTLQTERGSCFYTAVGVVPEFKTPFKPPQLLTHLFDGELARAGKEPWTVKR